MSVSETTVKKIKEKYLKFVEEVIEAAKNDKAESAVYGICIDFFNLDSN